MPNQYFSMAGKLAVAVFLALGLSILAPAAPAQAKGKYVAAGIIGAIVGGALVHHHYKHHRPHYKTVYYTKRYKHRHYRPYHRSYGVAYRPKIGIGFHPVPVYVPGIYIYR